MWTKILRLWWKLLAYFGKPEPEKFNILYLQTPVDIASISYLLGSIGYSKNMIGMVYSGQLLQMRKVHGNRQKHIRVYKNGRLTGHDELTPEYDIILHNKGITCRPLIKREIAPIILVLNPMIERRQK